jgi:hypothetical protein
MAPAERAALLISLLSCRQDVGGHFTWSGGSEFHSPSGRLIGTIYLLSGCKQLEKTVGLPLSQGGRLIMEHPI